MTIYENLNDIFNKMFQSGISDYGHISTKISTLNENKEAR